MNFMDLDVKIDVENCNICIGMAIDSFMQSNISFEY